METIVPPLSEPLPEYLYGQVKLDERIAKSLLKRNDAVGRVDDKGRAEFTFFIYAHDRDEAKKLPRNIRVFARELEALASDFDAFIENHDFPSEGSTEGERERERTE